MKLVSEPEFREEEVTDIDVAFDAGIQSLTLRQGDTYETQGDVIIVTRTEAKESITLFVPHIRWMAFRKRTMKYPVAEAGQVVGTEVADA